MAGLEGLLDGTDGTDTVPFPSCVDGFSTFSVLALFFEAKRASIFVCLNYDGRETIFKQK